MADPHASGREYAASDVKELMDNTGGWATKWDDVIRYLEGPAVKDSDFSKKEVPQLLEDVKHLKREHVTFTTDYRKVWKELTGEKADKLPEPEEAKKPPVTPIELEDKYLKGLEFPAKKNDVVAHAKKKDAPQRALRVLERIDSKEYREMADVLEAAGDVAWDH